MPAIVAPHAFAPHAIVKGNLDERGSKIMRPKCIAINTIYTGECTAPATIEFRIRGGNKNRPPITYCGDHWRCLDVSYLDSIEPIPGPPSVSSDDLEQVIADTENKVDWEGGHVDQVLADLLWRLRTLAGLDTSQYETGAHIPMTIGRVDRCLIDADHDAVFCGKPQAHRLTPW
jgi:hypothetical protein